MDIGNWDPATCKFCKKSVGSEGRGWAKWHASCELKFAKDRAEAWKKAAELAYDVVEFPGHDIGCSARTGGVCDVGENCNLEIEQDAFYEAIKVARELDCKYAPESKSDAYGDKE